MCSLSFFILLVFSLIILLFGFYYLLFDLSLFIEWELFSLNCSMVVMTLIIDWMSLIFMSFVMFIFSLVIYYSYDYMSGESSMNRFTLLVLMFIFSMIFLILSPNLISILLGWDGLGLISYCLVIYYYNLSSYNSGMLTALSNHVGDVAILISIAWMMSFGSWNYIFYYDFLNSSWEVKVITLLIVLAAITKSAQLLFSSWLPAAMAAPTPVSALVHSSTLATAGVYFIIRFNSMLIEFGMGKILLIIGCLTMFMSGFVANFEFDLKKSISLSTLSQLGLMMEILSMGFYKVAYFHMLTKALFKAFMCAGSMIHNLKDSQDIRFMVSVIYFMPLTSVCLNVSSLSLCGMPFLSGFYSKDLILELICFDWVDLFSFFTLFFSTGLTASYSFRLYCFSMFGFNNHFSSYNFDDHNNYISFSMISLLFISVFSGSLLSWLIFPFPYVIVLPFYLKILFIITVLLGFNFGYLTSCFSFKYTLFSFYWQLMISFLGSMWFMPYLSTNYLISSSLSYGYNVLKILDYGWGELMGGYSLYHFFIYMINYSQFWYDLNFKVYLFTFMFWMIILFMIFYIYFS
uniref:NADH-ubiquinone oxidoreductase chain 5 n=1 Tax=Mekongiana xiangchengensis TaxID=868576 RepID=E1ABT1_9ORTH|nr:NADH dehydrogenase subunit 5 [Mekongiana xiangchengensis]ADK77630.1 NADH dehydrogenase subunit 5 [Mekongiana xiangchengensis]